MPSVLRARVVVNGVQRMRTYHYYWCRYCQRSIRTTSANPFEILCPHCFGQVHYELDVTRPRLVLSDVTRLQPQPSSNSRLVDALALMVDPPIRQLNNDGDGSHRRTRQRARVILQFIGPDDQPVRPVPPHENAFYLPSIQELIQNDRPGPPPTQSSAIDALPSVVLASIFTIMTALFHGLDSITLVQFVGISSLWPLSLMSRWRDRYFNTFEPTSSAFSRGRAWWNPWIFL